LNGSTALVALLLATTLLAAWTGPTSCDCPSSRQFPSGTADANGGLAFVANSENGVTAVRLASGQIEWTSSSASVPIGVVPEGVFALGRAEDPREVQPVVLARSTGTARIIGKSFRPGRDLLNFALSAMLVSVEMTDAIVVRWRDIAADTRGPELDTGRSIRAGGFRMRLDGTVETIAAEAITRDLSRSVSAAYQRGSEYTSGTWGEGPCTRSLLSEERGDLIALSLCFHSGPEAAAERRRELAREKSLAVIVSLDGCSVFIETAVATQRAWLAFSSATGEPLGRVPREPSAWNPAALGDAIYYLVDGAPAESKPRTLLRAIDRSTGQKRWEIPVRGRKDTTGVR
jgi:hypothetical protein